VASREAHQRPSHTWWGEGRKATRLNGAWAQNETATPFPCNRPLAHQTSSGTVFARPATRIIAWPTGFGLRFPRKTRREVPERDVARDLRNVPRLSIAVNLPSPTRFSAGATVVMLEHRAAAHVKTTYVPIEPRVIRIARVKLTGALYSVFRMAEGRPPGKAFDPWSGYPIGWFEPASNFLGDRPRIASNGRFSGTLSSGCR
jgi:hypothetical protein